MSPPISIDGTDIAGATIDGQEVQEITVDGDTVFTAIPDSVVDNFEDGDTSVLKDNWSGWSGDMGSLAAQQDTVINGDWSGELSANYTVKSVIATRDSADTPSEVSCLAIGESRNGGANDSVVSLAVKDAGTRLFEAKLRSDGTFNVVGSNRGGTNWSVGDVILIRMFNIDWDNNLFDWEFVRDSDGTVLASDTNEAFRNSGSSADQIGILNDANGSGAQTAIFDDVKWLS